MKYGTAFCKEHWLHMSFTGDNVNLKQDDIDEREQAAYAFIEMKVTPTNASRLDLYSAVPCWHFCWQIMLLVTKVVNTMQYSCRVL